MFMIVKHISMRLGSIILAIYVHIYVHICHATAMLNGNAQGELARVYVCTCTCVLQTATADMSL